MKPDEQKLAEFRTPITFWSEHVKDGATICSITNSEFKDSLGQQYCGAEFARHAAFSTPVKEYTKALQK